MKFSIITPTYNRVDVLDRTIKSILKQEYQNFEMIIIDDGSTDKTEELMEQYRDNLKIKYIKMSKNSGVNSARNIGFDNVGEDIEWITLLDSDDEFLPTALTTMKSIIEKNHDYNYFRFAEIYETGKKASYSKHNDFVADYKSTIIGNDVHGGWTVTLNKNVIDRGFRFNESINGFESLSWFELSKTEECFYSQSIVKLYQTDTYSLTRPAKKDLKFYENCKKGNELIFEAYGDDMLMYGSKNLAPILYELGKLNLIMGERKKGLLYTLKALKLDPLNLRLFRNLLKFFTPSMRSA